MYMKKDALTLETLHQEAKAFCERQSKRSHPELIGITDGKAVGTYIEHLFQDYLSTKYDYQCGNSAYGIDFPEPSINTDMKVTSIKQPQSSCPFKSASQKIYGLGYNLLILTYEKSDSPQSCSLAFRYCTFVSAERTGDYKTTSFLIELIKNGANVEDIKSFLVDIHLPADEITLENLANEVLTSPPPLGLLTISNALQWRLQYKRVNDLDNTEEGVINYAW